MNYLIGTDEAGYGPNLGPLVISATVWEVPEHVRAGDLYHLLRETIVAALGELAGRSDCIAVTDSKALYPSAKGLYHLERGLLAALSLLGRCPRTWADYWEAVAPEATACRRAIPWYADFEGPVPVDACCDDLERLGPALGAGLAAASVRLIEIRSRVLFEPEFNERVEHYGSKGAALSHATLDLVANLIRSIQDGQSISVICDKHGGRNAYQSLLADHFPDSLIEIYDEGRQRSLYKFGPHDRRTEICFQVKAESYLPTALASMASKYLRELAMTALNQFWSARVPSLRPTAGYPQDAPRFKADIASAQAKLGIEDRMVWRVK